VSSLDPDLSFGEFDAVSFARWREAAEKALGAPLGAARDGIELPPVFADDDRPAGSRALSSRGGWSVGQELAGQQPGEIAACISEARGGLDVAWVELDGSQRAGCRVASPRHGLPLADARELAAIVDAARVSGVAVILRADAVASSALEAWRELEPAAEHLAGVVADPLGALAELGARGSSLRDAYAALAGTTRSARSLHDAQSSGSSPSGRPQVSSGARTLEPARPSIATVLADGVPWHDAGASPAVALGAALASALSHLQGLADHGVAHAEAAPHVALRLAIGPELLEGIAMLRAARLLWGACLRRLGAECEPRIWARTSWRHQSRLDLPVNLLRNTLGAFAAAVGGVEHLYVQPHTEACGEDEPDARRWARNIQHLLRGESQLHRVADPAAGSPYLEHLTRTIAAGAWKVARTLSSPDPERALVAALRQPHALLERPSAATRAMVGVDLHPDPQPPAPAHASEPGTPPIAPAHEPVVSAPALPRERLAAPLERIRERASAWAAARPPGASVIALAPDTPRPQRDAARRLAGLLGFSVAEGPASSAALAVSTELRVSRAPAESLDLAAILDRGAEGLSELLDRMEAAP
jgi:hypothetical protein